MAEMDDVDYSALLGLDDDLEPHGADSPLLDPGSDGLITAGGTDLLRELARRRAQGASLAEVRRAAGMQGVFAVTDSILERACEQGRRLEQYATSGAIAERSRVWRGARLPSRAQWEAAGCPPRRDRNSAARQSRTGGA